MRILHQNRDLGISGVVYQIECLITGDKYVGQTSRTLKQRITNHIGCHSNSTYSGCNKRTSLYDDVKKYGWENFELSIIATSPDETIRRKIVEKFCQNKIDFIKYAERDINRDTSKKQKELYCKFQSVGDTLYFKSPMEATKYFCKVENRNINRTSILKSITEGYKFLRKYKVCYCSKTEYMKSIGINQLLLLELN